MQDARNLLLHIACCFGTEMRIGKFVVLTKNVCCLTRHSVTGCETIVDIPEDVDNNATYSDDKWHQVVVTRTGVSGAITIDGNVTGS